VIFLTSQSPDWLWGPPSLLSNGYSSAGVKWPNCGGDHSHPSSAELKNVGVISLLPHTSSWHGVLLINQKENFTFYIHIYVHSF
jgi:hypothetical protein